MLNKINFIKLVILTTCLFTSSLLSANNSKTKKNNKLDACFITLNSKDEKETFIKHLPKKDFNFHEFVPKNYRGKKNENWQDLFFSNDSWFDEACKTKTQCDLVVISGHFAGSFFSDHSDITLTLNKMEQKSCQDDCKGILSSPTEVFLLGCNTLAGKTKDHRTPEEYIGVLVRDGFSLTEARQVASSRYGETGMSNYDRMRSVFNKTPAIYGFTSVGPLGYQAAPLLKNYLKKIPNYAEHIEKIAVSKTLAGIKSIHDFNNLDLKKSLAGYPFEDCSGIDLTGKDNERRKYICKLNDSKLSIEERMKLFESAINSPYAISLIGTLKSFAEELEYLHLQYGPESSIIRNMQAMISRLKENKKIKDLFTRLVKKDTLYAETKIDLIKLMNSIQILSDDELANNIKDVTQKVFDHFKTNNNDADYANLLAVHSLTEQHTKLTTAEKVKRFNELSAINFNLKASDIDLNKKRTNTFLYLRLNNSNKRNYLELIQQIKNSKSKLGDISKLIEGLFHWNPNPPLSKEELDLLDESLSSQLSRFPELATNHLADNLADALTGSQLLGQKTQAVLKKQIFSVPFKGEMEGLNYLVSILTNKDFFNSEELRQILALNRFNPQTKSMALKKIPLDAPDRASIISKLLIEYKNRNLDPFFSLNFDLFELEQGPTSQAIKNQMLQYENPIKSIQPSDVENKEVALSLLQFYDSRGINEKDSHALLLVNKLLQSKDEEVLNEAKKIAAYNNIGNEQTISKDVLESYY